MNKLITNLNLNPEETFGQSIYNSQLYGTFFGVYAYIRSEKIDEKKRIVTSMRLEVINYKGELDLGIEKAVYEPKSGGNGGNLKLHVRAVIGNSLNSTSRDAVVKTKDIEVEGIQGERFEKGAFINVQRYLKPIHSEKSEGSEPLNEGVFDSEFHYREGTIVEGYTLKPNSTHIGGRPAEASTEFAKNSDIGVTQSGHFCPWAELFLFWFG